MFHVRKKTLRKVVPVIDICPLVAPRAVKEMKDGVVWVPNTFTEGQKATLWVEVAANPNLIDARWTVNGKELDAKKFKLVGPIFDHPNKCLVGLDVEQFTNDDLKADFQLELTNAIACTSFNVKISPGEQGFGWK
jgi:hypothetical protein